MDLQLPANQQLRVLGDPRQIEADSQSSLEWPDEEAEEVGLDLTQEA